MRLPSKMSVPTQQKEAGAHVNHSGPNPWDLADTVKFWFHTWIAVIVLEKFKDGNDRIVDLGLDGFR
jgi:hypothetical protein